MNETKYQATRSACGCGCKAQNARSNSGNTWERRNWNTCSNCGCGANAVNTRSSGCGCGANAVNTRSSGCGCGANAVNTRSSGCGCGANAINTRSSGCGCGANTVWKSNSRSGCGCVQTREKPTCAQGAENGADLDGKSLAMVYSPYQKYEDLYGAKEGLCNGTIFCQLDKPFCPDGRR